VAHPERDRKQIENARTRPPVDDESDYSLEVRAGVIPVERRFGQPIDDPRPVEGQRPPVLG